MVVDFIKEQRDGEAARRVELQQILAAAATWTVAHMFPPPHPAAPAAPDA
jgi:hypothetical protein